MNYYAQFYYYWKSNFLNGPVSSHKPGDSTIRTHQWRNSEWGSSLRKKLPIKELPHSKSEQGAFYKNGT